MGRARRNAWIALSAGVTTAVAVVDALVGGDLVLIALLSVGPLLGSIRLGPGPTAGLAAYAIVLGFALGFPDDVFGEESHVVRLSVLGTLCVLALWVSRLGERLRSSHDQLRAILENVADGVTVQAPDGRLVFANRAAAQAVGMSSSDEMMSAPPGSIVQNFELLDEDGRPFEPDRLPGRRALRGEEPEPTVVRYRRRGTGEELWSVVKATPIRDESGEVQLAISVMEDVTDRMRAQAGERFLSESSKLLSASLDYETTLRRVAELTVPGIADWCAVDMPNAHGRLEQVALAAAVPEDLALADEMRTSYPPGSDAQFGAPRVLRTGRSELYPEITDEMLERSARDPRHLELIRRVGIRAAMVVPMTARGRTLGAITFAASRSRRTFDGDDLALAEELGRRAATAVDNARLFGERAYIARALQESLLPPTLPEVPGLEVAARFRAAGDGNEVGGDFYDLFNTGEELHWAVVMGDVCGKGADAAGLTALARYTLRAAAMREGRPSAVLGALNEAILRQRADEQFCTVAFARLERKGPATRLTVASGGHPLPLVLRTGGRVDAVGTPGTLLGILPDPDLRDDTAELGPGDALVLYTDGLTDAGAPDRVLSPADLAAILRECAGLDAAGIAEHVENAALRRGAAREPRDDVAILALRAKEPDRAG